MGSSLSRAQVASAAGMAITQRKISPLCCIKNVEDYYTSSKPDLSALHSPTANQDGLTNAISSWQANFFAPLCWISGQAVNLTVLPAENSKIRV